jgi:guanylate kinase
MTQTYSKRAAAQLLIVVSGPSGAGKDSVVRRLLEREPDLVFVVTTTTRPRRADEVDGRDYFFVSGEEFSRMVAADEFVEHALVYGEHKGVSRKEVQAAVEKGKDPVLRIDVQGAARIKHLYPNALLIFLTPGNEAELRARLGARETETKAGLERRLATAREEGRRREEFDYHVVNRRNDLEGTVKVIQGILSAERARVRTRTIET